MLCVRMLRGGCRGREAMRGALSAITRVGIVPNTMDHP